MNRLLIKIEELSPAYEQFWKEICEIETPSHDKAALNRLADKLQSHAEALGCSVYRESFERAGDCLRIDLAGDTNRKPIVLMAHMDTVHEVGAFGPTPVTIVGRTIYGPGVNDCKNGIVAAMLVLDALSQWNGTHPPVRVLFTSDEEVSARLSGAQGIRFFETHAAGAQAVLNCEYGIDGKACVGRKGIANICLEITGKAAHAGIAYFNGASAIREAAYKILALEALSQPDGNTVNCGVIDGGDKANIIADRCTILVDVRSLQEAGLEEAVAQVRAIAEETHVPGTRCTMTVRSCRPPMEPRQENYALLSRLSQMAVELGMEPLEGFISGGGSDAAYTTRMGIPTVCSIGPTGGEVHTLHEYANLDSLPQRSKLIAKAICEL